LNPPTEFLQRHNCARSEVNHAVAVWTQRGNPCEGRLYGDTAGYTLTKEQRFKMVDFDEALAVGSIYRLSAETAPFACYRSGRVRKVLNCDFAQKCGSARDTGADVFMLPLFDNDIIKIFLLSALALLFGKPLFCKGPHHTPTGVYEIQSGRGNLIYSITEGGEAPSHKRTVRLEIPNLLAETVVSAIREQEQVFAAWPKGSAECNLEV